MKLGKLKALFIALGLVGVNAGVLIPTTVGFFADWNAAQSSPIIDESAEVQAEALSILSNPSKTVYCEGETFLPTGLQLMATVNGKKKKISKGYTIVNGDRALLSSDTYITVTYGGQSINIPITVVVFNNLLTINKNGEYTVQAEDSGINTTLFSIADPAWSAGVNGSKFIEGWINDRVAPSSGQSLANLGVGTTIAFKFTVTSSALIQFYNSCAFTTGDRAAELMNFTIDDQPIASDQNCTLSSIPGATDNGGLYWNWQNWYMGQKQFEPGTYVFKITGNKRLPNIDCFKFKVSNMQAGQLFTISSNGTTRLEAEDSNIDRSGWSLRADYIAAGREPVETWNNPNATYLTATSGRNVNGLNVGCEISLPFKMDGNAHILFRTVIASSTAGLCCDAVSVTLDGFACPGYSTTQSLGSGNGSTYWNWIGYNCGESDVSAGYHILVVRFSKTDVNIDSFEFVTTEYRAGESVFDISGNGTTTFQAESGRLPRNTWLVRDDFVIAGRLPVESWAISSSGQSEAVANAGASSGKSTCGLRIGTAIEIKFTLLAKARVQFNIICATYVSVAAHQVANAVVDGNELNGTDTTLVLGKYGDSNSGEQYWNWKVFNAGYADLQAGVHTFSVTLLGEFNCDSFKFVTTNYGV